MNRLAMLVALALSATTTGAEPMGAHRKTVSDKFAKAASESFVAALAADQKGDLPTALALYQKAFAISPHPSTAYNIGDVLRRLGRLTDSVRSYEMYLAIAPGAPDRKEVEALIDKLAHTPGRVFVMSSGVRDPKSIDLATGYVLIDGKIMFKPGTKLAQAADAGDNPGIELTMVPGDYHFDVVTPLTYGSTTCEVRPNERSLCTLTAPPRTDGPVVISGTNRHLMIGEGRRGKRQSREDTRMLTRFDVKPGRVKLAVRDGSYECAALVLDVPSGGDVAYAFFAEREPTSVERCRTHDVTHLRLHFAP